MTPWSIALQNLTVIPPDDRLTCKICGAKFHPYQSTRSVYCSPECQVEGASENKRQAAKRAKERKRAMSCV